MDHRIGMRIPFGEQVGKVGDMVGIFMRQDNERDFRHQDRSTSTSGPVDPRPTDFPGTLGGKRLAMTEGESKMRG